MSRRMVGIAWGAALIVVGFAAQAPALTIHTVYTPLGGNAWRAEFHLNLSAGESFSQDQGFTVYFDYGSFDNLRNGQADGDTDPNPFVLSDTSASWDLWVDEPDPSWSWDGIFDAFALENNAPTDGPFLVEFDWLGSGAPGELYWEKYHYDYTFTDPIVLDDSGFASYTVVPEPGTLVLLGTGLVGLAARKRRVT